MSEKTNYKYFLGIDVAKYKMDIFNTISGEYTTVKNTEVEIKKFIKNLNSLLFDNNNNKEEDKGKEEKKSNNNQTIDKKDILIIIDLTGGYEKKAIKLFYQNGFCNIIRAEGLKVKNFSKSTKYNRAKTDKKDSEVLVEYGKHFYDKISLYNPDEEIREYIADLYCRIEDLKFILQQEKNRIQQPNLSEIMKKSIKEIINTLEKEINTLKEEIIRNINLVENSELKLIYETLKKQQGIGEELAMFLLIKLKELGKIERKQLTSICGLAPISNDSGTFTGHRYVRGGRKEIRSKMYFCAMNMTRFNKKFREKMEEMVSRGKNKKVILTALARKEITILNAIIRDTLKEKGYSTTLNELNDKTGEEYNNKNEQQINDEKVVNC